MLWFTLALLTAFFSATEAALIKKLFGDLATPEMAVSPLLFGLPLFLILFCFLEAPPLAPGFWTTMVVLLPVNMAGFGCYMYAIQKAPLSLAMPVLSVSPAIVIGTGFLFLGEMPNLWGALGILAIASGSYVLNLDTARNGDILGPFKSLFKEPGVLAMLGAATIFAFAAVLGRKLILESSAVYAGALFFILHNTIILVVLRAFKKISFRSLLSRPKSGVAVGIASFGHIFCHFTSIALVAAAYMIAIKRLSSIFSVAYGGLIFKESNIMLRLMGAALMSVGAAVITIYG